MLLFLIINLFIFYLFIAQPYFLVKALRLNQNSKIKAGTDIQYCTSKESLLLLAVPVWPINNHSVQ